MASLQQVNEGLADIGVPAVLDADLGLKVARHLGRDRFLNALHRARHGDSVARAWIERSLSRLGVIGGGPDEAPPANDDQQEPERAHRAAEVNTDGAERREREFVSHHVYGGRDALCFDCTETRNGFHTISIDAAKGVGDGSRRRNWKDKVTVQITSGEFPVVFSVLSKQRQKCEFSAHGPNNDKGFSMEIQGENVYCKVWAKDRGVVGVPVTPADRAHLVALMIRQWMKNYPWLDPSATLLSLR